MYCRHLKSVSELCLRGFASMLGWAGVSLARGGSGGGLSWWRCPTGFGVDGRGSDV